MIDPLDLIDVYGVDPLRFYVLRAVPFGQDGSASLDGVRERYDRELANDLGNLLSRTTAMISKYRDGRIPLAAAPGGGERLAALSAGVAIKLDRFDLTGALEDLWAYVRDLNGYVTAQKPWELAKDEANAAELDTVLFTLADGLRAVAVGLAPFLPETAPRILAALGQPEDVAWSNFAYGLTVATDGVGPAEPLFPRIEVPEAA